LPSHRLSRFIAVSEGRTRRPIRRATSGSWWTTRTPSGSACESSGASPDVAWTSMTLRQLHSDRRLPRHPVHEDAGGPAGAGPRRAREVRAAL